MALVRQRSPMEAGRPEYPDGAAGGALADVADGRRHHLPDVRGDVRPRAGFPDDEHRQNQRLMVANESRRRFGTLWPGNPFRTAVRITFRVSRAAFSRALHAPFKSPETSARVAPWIASGGPLERGPNVRSPALRRLAIAPGTAGTSALPLPLSSAGASLRSARRDKGPAPSLPALPATEAAGRYPHNVGASGWRAHFPYGMTSLRWRSQSLQRRSGKPAPKMHRARAVRARPASLSARSAEWRSVASASSRAQSSAAGAKSSASATPGFHHPNRSDSPPARNPAGSLPCWSKAPIHLCFSISRH